MFIVDTLANLGP